MRGRAAGPRSMSARMRSVSPGSTCMPARRAGISTARRRSSEAIGVTGCIPEANSSANRGLVRGSSRWSARIASRIRVRPSAASSSNERRKESRSRSSVSRNASSNWSTTISRGPCVVLCKTVSSRSMGASPGVTRPTSHSAVVGRLSRTGTTPALMMLDFPHPDGPTTATKGLPSSRRSTRSAMSPSRPNIHPASSSPNGLSPL